MSAQLGLRLALTFRIRKFSGMRDLMSAQLGLRLALTLRQAIPGATWVRTFSLGFEAQLYAHGAAGASPTPGLAATPVREYLQPAARVSRQLSAEGTGLGLSRRRRRMLDKCRHTPPWSNQLQRPYVRYGFWFPCYRLLLTTWSVVSCGSWCSLRILTCLSSQMCAESSIAPALLGLSV